MRQILVKEQPGVMSEANSGEPVSAPFSETEKKEEGNELHEGDEEPISLSERQSQNAKSAFEITSVDPVPADNDDLESSILQKGASADESLKTKIRMRSKGESISEEESVSPLQELKTEAIPGSATNPTGDDNTSKDAHSDAFATDHDAAPAHSGLIAPGGAQSSQLLSQGSAGATGNGPTLQHGLSRFRRVNQYSRGRWMVRDRTEPEEKPDCEPRGPTPGLKTDSSSFGSSASTPLLPQRKVQPTAEGPEHFHTHSASDLTQVPSTSSAPSDSVSDKDSSSIPVDRSSTTDTSFSSIITTDKSTDGDESVRDSEHELAAVRDISDSSIPLQPLTNLQLSITAGSSMGSGINLSGSSTPHSTPIPTEVPSSQNPHGPSCTCEACLEGRKDQEKQEHMHRVQNALSHLQEELAQLLKNDTHAQMELLTRKNNLLQDQNKSLREENEKLRLEIESLRTMLAKHADSQHVNSQPDSS